MVFNESALGSIIFFVLVSWIAGLTIVVVRLIRHYNALAVGSQKTSLKDVLDSILATQKSVQGQTKELYQILEEQKKDGKLHIQRVGLVRFNPFADTGGSQSFTLALLDGYDNGLVMTSLYARTGHRWYIKEVAGGKGKELALSREEQAAVQKAKPFEGVTR
jgi:hypothetical protein